MQRDIHIHVYSLHLKDRHNLGREQSEQITLLSQIVELHIQTCLAHGEAISYFGRPQFLLYLL